MSDHLEFWSFQRTRPWCRGRAGQQARGLPRTSEGSGGTLSTTPTPRFHKARLGRRKDTEVPRPAGALPGTVC